MVRIEKTNNSCRLCEDYAERQKSKPVAVMSASPVFRYHRIRLGRPEVRYRCNLGEIIGQDLSDDSVQVIIEVWRGQSTDQPARWEK